MSNVLIGIIGVILFIGLALAGALFLGPRFQESTNNSKAAATVQVASQISSALNLSTVQTGTTIMASGPAAVGSPAGAITALVPQGYMKSMPVNPITASSDHFLVASDGATVVTTLATHVVMPLGSSADKVCDAIARQSGQTAMPTVATAAEFAAKTTSPSGCFKTSAIVGSLSSGVAYAYARL